MNEHVHVVLEPQQAGVACLVRGQMVAVVEFEDRSALAALWDAVGEDPSIDGALAQLMAGGLSEIGSFAMVERDGAEARLLVRGEGTVTFVDSEDAERITATRVRTWVEKVVTGSATLIASIGTPNSDPGWPVSEGLVPANTVRIGPTVLHSPHSIRATGEDAVSATAPDDAEIEPHRQRLDGSVDGVGRVAAKDENKAPDITSPVDEDDGDRQRAGDLTQPGLDEAADDVLEQDHGFGDIEAERPGVAIEHEEPTDGAEVTERAAVGEVSGSGSDSPEEAESHEDPEEGDGVQNYDEFFGHTRARSVESAAVRIEDGEDSAAGDDGASLGSADEGALDEDARGPLNQPATPEDQRSEESDGQPTPSPTDQRSAAAATDAAKAGGQSSSAGLITSVPSSQPITGTPPPPPPAPNQSSAGPASTGVSVEEQLGDRFGDTVARPRAARSGQRRPTPPASAASGAQVQAVVCGAGHANPTQRSACRTCGGALSAAPVLVPRPVLGRLHRADGEVHELDRPLIIGRRPRIEGKIVSEVPRTVVIGSDHTKVSRQHLMLRLEAWDVLVEDLGSSFGTKVIVPGRPPQRLRAGVPVHLSDGTVIELGEEVTYTFESLN